MAMRPVQVPTRVKPVTPRRVIGALAAFFLTLDGMSVAVLWGCIVAARAVPALVYDPDVSEPLVAAITLPLLVILPRQTGMLLRPVLEALAPGFRTSLTAPERHVVVWLVGLCAIVMGATILTGMLGIPSPATASVVLLAVTASGVVFGAEAMGSRGRRKAPTSWTRLVGQGWPYAAAACLASIPLALIRVNQPYPLQTGWGLFNYNFRILEFLELNHISIAPGVHTPVHASLFGVSTLATGADSFGLIWATPMLLYITYGLGLYAFARKATGRNVVALAVVWVAIWILSLAIFQNVHAASLRGLIFSIWPWLLLVLHGRTTALRGTPSEIAARLAVPLGSMAAIALVRWLLPGALQPWTLLLVALLVYGVLRSRPMAQRQDVALLTVVGSSLTFIHFLEGPLFFVTGLAFICVLAWRPTGVASRRALAAYFAAVACFVGLQAWGVLTFDDPSAISRVVLGAGRADAIRFGFEGKLDLFKIGLPYAVLGLLAFSACRVLVLADVTQRAALTAVALATLLYFMPESGLHRALGPAIPLIGLSVALELHWLASRAVTTGVGRPPAAVAAVLVAAAAIALTPTLTSSLRSQVGLPSRFGFPLPQAGREFSDITRGEYLAGQWIESNTPAQWAIVSDPTTMFFMEGLTLHPQVALERAWVAESEYTPEDRARLRAVDRVFRATTVDEAIWHLELLTKDSPGALLVVSYRTIDWLGQSEDLFWLPASRYPFPLWPDAVSAVCGHLQIEPCPDRFMVSEAFSVVYQWGGVAVLVPRHQLSALDGRESGQPSSQGDLKNERSLDLMAAWSARPPMRTVGRGGG